MIDKVEYLPATDDLTIVVNGKPYGPQEFKTDSRTRSVLAEMQMRMRELVGLLNPLQNDLPRDKV